MKIEKTVIAQDERHYLAWPDLIQTRTGRLLCVFSSCTHHCDRSSTQIMVCFSDDEGASWSKPLGASEPCGLAATGYYYNNATLSQLADGRIALAYDRIDGKDEDRAPTYIMLTFSQDDGASWSSPVATPAVGIVPDRLQETASGRWLLACHRYNEATGKLVQRLWFSDDRGGNWQGPVIVAASPELNLCEGSLLEVSPGTLVCWMRENSFTGLPCYRSISTDDGRSWSEPMPFPLPACHRPKAGFLADGRIAITYRFFPGGHTYPQNTFLALTDRASALEPDYRFCRTRILLLDHDAAARSDTGYTGWCQLADGSLFIANYIKDTFPQAWIRGYRVTLEEPLPE